MPRDRRVLLHDALEAAKAIQEFIGEKSFDEYDQNELLQAAVERKFEIVGEALNVARNVDPYLDESITNLPGIVRVRNFLAHAYHSVINRKLWDIRERDLPILIQELRAILESEPPPTGKPLD